MPLLPVLLQGFLPEFFSDRITSSVFILTRMVAISITIATKVRNTPIAVVVPTNVMRSPCTSGSAQTDNGHSFEMVSVPDHDHTALVFAKVISCSGRKPESGGGEKDPGDT